MGTIGSKQIKEICEEHGFNYYFLTEDIKDMLVDAYERGYERFYDED